MTRRLVAVFTVALLVASALLFSPRARAQTPTLPRVWVRDLPGATVRESSPLLTDVDADGGLDLVFGAHDGKLWALRGGDGSTVDHWPQPTSNQINSSPSAADVDGDGRPELFVGSGTDSESTGALYSFATDGRLRFRLPLADNDFPRGAPVHSSPAIGDINRDGVLDAVVGALGVRSLWATRAVDGVVPSGRDLFYWDDTIFSSPAIADVNGDGIDDVVIGGDSSPGPPVDWRGGMVRAVSGTGQSLWEFRTNDIVRSSPAIGDLDGDGKLEVVVGGGDFWHGSDGNAVFALDAATGALKWRRDLDGITNASPALADLDGDGDLDVAMGTFNSVARGLSGGSVYALDGRDGRDLSGFPQASGGGVVLGSIVTVDVDGDGAQDLLVPTGAYIAAFNGRNGTRLFNLAEGDSVGFQNSPAVADVDADGRLDIVAVGTRTNGNGVAYRWELPASAELGRLGWHQFHKDSRRTGSWTSSVPDAATVPYTRRAGNDRYETAAALSTGASTGNVVYVATGEAFPDALAGAPAAAAKGSAVLLVTRDAIPSATRNRLGELKPRQIFVLGGPAAVSDGVVADLGTMATAGASRLAGSDRYGTAAAVSTNAFTTPLVPVVYVATGAAFADALTGGAAGSLRGGPILLVDRDTVPSSTSTELRRLLPRSIVILGGTNAVSQSVETQLRTYAADVSRVAGNDRYASSVALSRSLFPNGASVAYIATGTNFPDALAGGPPAGGAKAPMLLVPGQCITNVVRSELERLGVGGIVLLGGGGAVSGAVAAFNPCS